MKHVFFISFFIFCINFLFQFYTGCQGMVSQEFQGAFIKENVVENLYTAFG
jgi:hypothetical protein